MVALPDGVGQALRTTRKAWFRIARVVEAPGIEPDRGVFQAVAARVRTSI